MYAYKNKRNYNFILFWKLDSVSVINNKTQDIIEYLLYSSYNLH